MRQFAIMFLSSIFGLAMGLGAYMEIMERPEEFRIQTIFCLIIIIIFSIFFTWLLESSKPE